MSNDVKLLREFVSLLLNEKIRSKTFDQRKFRALTSEKDMLNYAFDHLKKIDSGSSRAVFELTSKRVLKIALNSAGIAQNEAEVSVFTDPRTKNIFAKTLDADENYKWLASEMVRPITDTNEWNTLAKIDYEDFKSELGKSVFKNEKSSNKFVNVVDNAIKTLDLLPGDVVKLSSWGKTTDGRIVLLDYGATEDVFKTHYTPKKVQTSNKEKKTVKEPHRDTAATAAEPGADTSLFL